MTLLTRSKVGLTVFSTIVVSNIDSSALLVVTIIEILAYLTSLSLLARVMIELPGLTILTLLLQPGVKPCLTSETKNLTITLLTIKVRDVLNSIDTVLAKVELGPVDSHNSSIGVSLLKNELTIVRRNT